jgi:hypothetical protein
MTVTFEIVHPVALEPEDLKNIEKALEMDFTGATLEDVLHAARTGVEQIWVLKSPEGRGIVTTCIATHRAGKEIFTWLIAGSGMRPHVDFILDRMIEYAKAGGCSWLRGLAVRWFADRLVAEKGYEEHSVCVIRRI